MVSRLNKTRNDDSIKRKSANREAFSEDRYKEICFNFKYLDKNQGQTYENWEEEKLLALMLNRFTHLSSQNIMEAQKGILKIYGEQFPDKSAFDYPDYIPQNVKWGSIRIQGEERVIGFIKDNIFYVVFLDKNHKFWPSTKKNT